MLLAGSLWVLVGGGVACLERASGTGRPSDLTYVLILDLTEEVKETLVIGGLMRGLKGGKIPNDGNQIVSLKRWLC